MATTNFDRYDLNNSGAENVREDLSDVIINIDPTETPFVSRICKKTTSKNTYFEWLIDDLGSVDSANALVDGADAGADQSAAADRVGNYHQISGKVARVSGRAEKVNKAGRSSELKYQMAKLGKALKRDMETILTGNQASVAGSSSVASKTGSLRAWLATNDSLGAAPGASGGFASGIVAAATDGVLRALSEATLLGIVKDCYVAGGNPSVFMVSPSVKQRMSAYMFGTDARIATPYKEANDTAMMAIGAVDVYVTDFGKVNIIPNRFQRDRDVFVLDTSMWEISYLRPFMTEKLAKTGDAENRQLLVDYGLKSKNEAASGVVADVNHATAMVA